jgi:hypothetical protein
MASLTLCLVPDVSSGGLYKRVSLDGAGPSLVMNIYWSQYPLHLPSKAVLQGHNDMCYKGRYKEGFFLCLAGLSPDAAAWQACQQAPAPAEAQ